LLDGRPTFFTYSINPGFFYTVLIRIVQSGSAELVSLLSEDRPDLIVPYFDIFIRNLKAKDPILRWETVCTLGNLVGVDEKKKKLSVLPKPR
jgi:hypothetical protein